MSHPIWPHRFTDTSVALLGRFVDCKRSQHSQHHHYGQYERRGNRTPDHNSDQLGDQLGTLKRSQQLPRQLHQDTSEMRELSLAK